MVEKFPKVIARSEEGTELVATGKVQIGEYSDYAIFIRKSDGTEFAKDRPIPLQQFLKHDDRDFKKV